MPKILQRLAAGCGSDLHFDQRLGESGAAHLRFDTHGGQCCRKAQHLRFGKPHLFARARHAMRHLHNGLFRRGKIVAQIHQRGTDIVELALAGSHDVGKLRDGGGGVICIQILAGIAQVDHDAGEVRQMLGSNAQLSACRHDFVNLVRARRNLRGHFLRRGCQLLKLRLRRVHGLSDRREGGFKVNGGLDRRRAQRHNGRGQRRGEQLSRLRQILAGVIAGFPEGFHALPGFRPFGLCGFQLFIAAGDVRLRLLYCGAGIVERGFRILHRVGGLTDLVRVADLLGGLQLFLCGIQGFFIFGDRLLLQPQFFLKQRQLRGQPGSGLIEILHARRSQTIAALGGFHLFADGSDAALAGPNCFSGRRPAGARKSKLAVALADLDGGFFDRTLRAVQFGLRRGECVRRVLRGFFQRDVLPFQLFEFLNGCAVFTLISVQICLCGNGRRIRFAQRMLIVLIRLCGAGHFCFQLLLFVLRVRQPLRVVVLPGIALLQLIAGLLKRTLILSDRILLKLEGALERGQFCRQPRRGRLEILHAGGSQMKRRFRFLYLPVDGFNIARKVIAVQRQRYHEIAERLAHAGSPAFRTKEK